MTDDEIELAILQKYVGQHKAAAIADPELRDKCTRELSMKEVIQEITRSNETELEYLTELWFTRLVSQGATLGTSKAPLLTCSDSGLNHNAHRFHARAFLNPSNSSAPAWDRINELDEKIRERESFVPSSTKHTTEGRLNKNMQNNDVFISHSNRDADVAQALIELLHNASNVPNNRIRCTSVDGYRLDAGANTDQQLRAEVKEARFFIGLITPASMQSAYVLFELGARWGAGLHLAPLLAAGAASDLLKGPLSGLNALNCSNEVQMHQLVRNVAELLGYEQASADVYDRYVKRLVSLSDKASQLQNP